MITLPATKARAKLYSLIDEAAASHKPIQITGKRCNAVLVSEEDWAGTFKDQFERWFDIRSSWKH
jgi:antitoxin YefM